MNAITEIFEPYENGYSSMILTGRRIYDLECRQDGSIATIERLMEEHALQHHMVVIRYILSKGIKVPYSLYEKKDVDTIKRVLAANEITGGQCASGNCTASQDYVKILGGIARMATSPNAEVKWQDGERMRFLFLFEFASDNMPDVTKDNERSARQLIYQLADSTAFRDNENLLILSDVVEEKIDSQVRGLLYHKYLPYPSYEEKLKFVKGLHKKYPNANYTSDIDDNRIANILSCTPNRGLDRVFYASNKNNCPIEVKGLVDQKTIDIQTISEKTLTVLDTSRVKNVTLAGENVRKPMEFLFGQVHDLALGKTTTHLNIVLMGAPGTGKTTLVLIAAQQENVPALQLNSPKAGIVGETERKAALQAITFSSTTPCVGIMDEITEGMPTQRTQNLDSGASDAVMQAQLNMLSDNSRAGKSILFATTNCGLKMGSAMRDRFLVVPVIMPSIKDMPEIICSIAKQICGAALDPKSARITAAARIFYEKHLMARRICAVLKLECRDNNLTPEDVYNAAVNATPLDEASWLSAVYADLVAISLTVSKRLLPWDGREDTYPYPDYILEVLDENHQVDSEKLNAKLKQLQPYVNV